MLRKITVFLIVIVIVTAAVSVIFIQNNKPVYKGSIAISGLDATTRVYFDDFGIPHIFANSEKDVYRALGYVHAQDRLWQMELLRRVAAGRLAEIFGEELVDTDKMFRGMGLDRLAERTVAQADKTSQAYMLAEAYLDGVNQFIDQGETPIEFRLVGVKKEHYTMKDIYNVFGYMAFSFAQAHKTDPLLSDLKETLGDTYLLDLDIDVSPKTTLLKNSRGMKRMVSSMGATVNDHMESLPLSPFIGSNSWVIGPQKTKNGKVILANDPHIGFAQPSVWYQAHLVTPEHEMYGFHLALCPFPILGHNYDYAYGITMFENDDVDFFQEPDDQQYEVREEIIVVKGSNSVVFEVRTGPNGPLMNDLFTGLNPEKNLSMDWVYTSHAPDLLSTVYDLSHAASLLEFKDAVATIKAPGLNMMYGDARGNIAWFGAGSLYERGAGVSTKFLLDGSNDAHLQKDYLDFDLNPQAINPSWHYVYSANNQPEEVNGKLYPGYYVTEDRARRIVELLEANDEFTQSQVEVMINDDTSVVVTELVKIIIDNISKVNLTAIEQQAIAILAKWKGDFKKDAVAPTIYTKFVYEFLKNTFEDEMGEERFEQFLRTHLSDRQIAKQLKWNKSVWWDDIDTEEVKELKDEIITRSFHRSIASLQEQFGDAIEEWNWSKALTVTHKHAFDKSTALRGFFNVGPFETDGGHEVINNQIFRFNGKGIYQVTAGPSTRRVIDFSDVENGKAILPTGQSGNVFSKHYDDQAQKYLKGEFVKMMLNKDEIKASSDMLLLKPLDSLE